MEKNTNAISKKSAALLKNDIEIERKMNYLESKLRIVLSSRLACRKDISPISSVIYITKDNEIECKYIDGEKILSFDTIDTLKIKTIEKFRTMRRKEAIMERDKMINKRNEINDESIINLINNYILEIVTAINEYDLLVASLLEYSLEDLM